MVAFRCSLKTSSKLTVIVTSIQVVQQEEEDDDEDFEEEEEEEEMVDEPPQPVAVITPGRRGRGRPPRTPHTEIIHIVKVCCLVITSHGRWMPWLECCKRVWILPSIIVFLTARVRWRRRGGARGNSCDAKERRSRSSSETSRGRRWGRRRWRGGRGRRTGSVNRSVYTKFMSPDMYSENHFYVNEVALLASSKSTFCAFLFLVKYPT